MDPVLIALVSALASFAGSYGAVTMRLKWHTAEIIRAHERIDRLEQPYFQVPRQARGGKAL